MRSDYQERQDNRREAYERLAAKRSAEAESRANSANVRTLIDMQGEPIKIGHHSERRHRRLLERADNDMRKSVEASQAAKYFASRAGSVGDGGISQDDPDAVAKLRAELADLQRENELRKAINAALRPLKLKTQDAWIQPALARLIEKLGEDQGRAAFSYLADAVKFEPAGFAVKFPAYVGSNANANMRRLRKRIEQLEALPPADAEPVRLATYDEHNPDFAYAETRPDLGRVCFVFSFKPSESDRDSIKRAGFRWSSREGVWLRHLNANGLYAARRLAKHLGFTWLGKYLHTV